MSDYTSLAIGTATLTIAFLSTLFYMRKKRMAHLNVAQRAAGSQTAPTAVNELVERP